MANERRIPTSQSSDLVTFKLFSEGTQVSDIYQVASIVVTKEVNRISTAQLTFVDGDPALEDFPVSNAEEFLPGKAFEVHAGYHSDETVIFKGIIVKSSIKSQKNRTSVFRILCSDEAVKLTVGRKNKYFYDSKDSDIIQEIASDAGLQTEIDDTGISHQSMVQYYATDWDFVVSRADATGMQVFTDDNILKLKAPDLSASPTLSLVYGDNILAFETEMDARDQFAGVKAKSWDNANQDIIETESEAFNETLPGDITTDDLSGIIGLDAFGISHGGGLKDLELQAWANAQNSKSKISKVKGRFQIQGYGDIKPGNMVELSGIGNHFNGNAFVSAVRHEITSENWITNLGIGISRKWFSEENDGIVDTPASGILPAVNGLQIGIVTALEGDPDGEFRVQVRMPLIDRSEGVWARVALLDAGANRGSFFRPEIEDEVVLGFMNDDPRDPVILGMLHSSAKPTPIEPSDDNHKKGFVTRSEMKLIFDDDKKVIQIETPNGNTLTFSDDEGKVEITDENNNKMTLDSSGILMETNSDVNIKATGDINIEGMNVNLKANANVKAEGNAGAEISSGAMTEIKGSLVKIN